jgi:hypothetical protein
LSVATALYSRVGRSMGEDAKIALAEAAANAALHVARDPHNKSLTRAVVSSARAQFKALGPAVLFFGIPATAAGAAQKMTKQDKNSSKALELLIKVASDLPSQSLSQPLVDRAVQILLTADKESSPKMKALAGLIKRLGTDEQKAFLAKQLGDAGKTRLLLA